MHVSAVYISFITSNSISGLDSRREIVLRRTEIILRRTEIVLRRTDIVRRRTDIVLRRTDIVLHNQIYARKMDFNIYIL